MGFARLAGVLKDGFRAGMIATKTGVSIPKIVFADAADAATVAGQNSVVRNATARLTNAVTSPPAAQNVLSGVVGIAYGQNPFAAVGANIAGNYADRVVGSALRSRFGEDSLRAAAAGGLTNLGVSIAGGNILNGFLQGDPEAEARQNLQVVQSQRMEPSAGSGRQFADLAASQGSYQAPGRPEATPAFADAAAGSMVALPPLDAATADKLRKRAIENAQQGYFLSNELSSYMDGLK